MKKIVSVLAIVCAVFAFVSCNSEEETNATASSLDFATELSAKDVGYALGVIMGEQLTLTGMDIDYDEFAKGVKDFATGKAKLDLNAAQQTLQVAFTQQTQKLAKKNAEEGSKFLEENKKRAGVVTTASGLQYEVIVEGNGAKPLASDTVIVDYVGTLIDGTEFDSSIKRGQPAEIPLGMVIPGWTEGIQLMSVGSKYKFYIPSELGYGEGGSSGGIEPNSTLIFEVELFDIVKAKE